MKLLKVLLIHRDNCNYRNLTGWWSYPVPQFTWDTVKVQPANFEITVRRGDYDLVVLDDWIFGRVNHDGVPMAYVVVDSMRSESQLSRNRAQAAQADIVLVDSDDLSKFSRVKPTHRFAYAVNETLYYPRLKEYDVAFLCWPTPPRRETCDIVEAACERNGWSFLTGTYRDHRDYAAALASAKVVVHKAHVEAGRSWRVFDVMATNACLLTSPLPAVSGDGLVDGVHYVTYDDNEKIETQLQRLMTDDTWSKIAWHSYRHIMTNHTWMTRATELRSIIEKEFGL